MTVDLERVRERLKQFEFKKLFIEELGWDKYNSQLNISVNGTAVMLKPIAEKRGMVVLNYCSSDNGTFPEYASRREIEREIAKRIHEHIVIYSDGDKGVQTWQWVKRELGRPNSCREFTVYANHSGESLAQRLQGLNFELSEEDNLTIVQVRNRTRQALDAEQRITRRFYDKFKDELSKFLDFIDGITASGDREWYASLMLNRLMFIYFIQKKGFLDNDTNYLRNRLAILQQKKGKDQFLSFYKHFLLRLFHEGLGKPRPTPNNELDQLLGKVPYINGGLFDVHDLERAYSNILVPDQAFEQLFNFFDSFDWHLDNRPLRSDREINPDVLGYIFEKYVNQKQMGAYYTKEDITGYIAQNTIIPHLFGRVENLLRPDALGFVQLLMSNPTRYIPKAVTKSIDSPLPERVICGINDFGNRSEWNRAADVNLAHPGETWREVKTRRDYFHALRRRLETGEIRRIADCVPLNIDLRQLAQDCIEESTDPLVIAELYLAIREITVLDPTCGSGAFLFAALNILEPLYESCLSRMSSFVRDGQAGEQEKRFRDILEQVASHPNERYFVLKSIIIGNLFGVDIMEEATEICKLRLFLKLMSQVSTSDELEPLPDTDFNIRAGNTLIGFTSLGQIRAAITGEGGQHKLDLNNTAGRIEKAATEADQCFQQFRRLQTTNAHDKEIHSAKDKLRTSLGDLRHELDVALASTFGIDGKQKSTLAQWKDAYKPFHWLVEFFSIMHNGGFDVIIGNPPYLEAREVEYKPKDFKSLDSGAIHAMCVERSCDLLQPHGSISMIVPLSLVSTQRMTVVQQIIESNRSTCYSNFSWRPGKLFDTVNRALTIFVASYDDEPRTYSTNYQKWNSDSRDLLMPLMRFVEVPRERSSFWVPKLGLEIERAILSQLLKTKSTVGDLVDAKSTNRLYYRTTGGLYWKVFTDFAPAFFVNGKAGHSTRETSFGVSDTKTLRALVAILSSDLFWWWYTVTSNLRDLNPADIHKFPVPSTALKDRLILDLAQQYLSDLHEKSVMLERNQRQTGRTQTQSFKVSKSKPIIDQIDEALGPHYGLTDETIEFIKNYDVRFRLGVESETDE